MPFSNSGVAPRLAQIVQASLKDLGFDVVLEPMAAAGLPTRQQNGTDWHAAMQDFSAVIARSNPDLPPLGQPNPGDGTWRGIYGAGIEANPLLDEARQTRDRAKQKQLYLDVAKILYEAAGVAYLHRNMNLVPMRKDLMGYRHPVSQYDNFPELLWLQK